MTIMEQVFSYIISLLQNMVQLMLGFEHYSTLHVQFHIHNHNESPLGYT